MRYLHVSKELVVVPRMALGTDGKPVAIPGEFDYTLAKFGHTYRRPKPKLMSRRDEIRLVGRLKRQQWHVRGRHEELA